MPQSRMWLSGFRLFVALGLLVGLSGTAAALQEQPDRDDILGTEESDEFPGLVEEGEYVSPQFGVEATWTDEWAVGDPTDPIVEHAIGGNFDNSVASDPELGDIVFLVDTASESSVLSLGFNVSEAPIDPELYLPLLEEQSFLTDSLFLSEDAELLLIDASDEAVAVLARDAAPNDEHLVYWMTYTDPGREDFTMWVGLDLYEPDEYERILESAEDDIEVEGLDVFPVFDANDMLDAIESGPEPTEEPTEVPATEEPTEEPTEVPATEEPTEEPTEVPATEEPTEEPEEIIGPTGSPVASPEASPEASPGADGQTGLLGPGNYLSPQHLVAITWSPTTWVPDPNLDNPFSSFEDSTVDEVHLVDSAGQGVEIFISIEAPNPDFDPDVYLEGITTPSYIETVLGLAPGSRVIASESSAVGVAAVYLDESGETPFVSIMEVHVIDDDTLVFVEIRADAGLLDETLLTSVATEVRINNQPSLILLDAVDIAEAIAGS